MGESGTDHGGIDLKRFSDSSDTFIGTYRAMRFLHGYPESRDAKHHYDMKRLMHIGWMKFWHKTLFNSPRIFVVLLVSMCGLTLLSLTTCPDPVINLGFCVNLTSNSSWFVFSGLTSFLLALFVGSTFGRWWAIRERLQSMQVTLLNASLLVSGGRRVQKELPAARTVIRYMHLVQALAFKAFREEPIDETIVQVRMPDGQPLATNKEYNYLLGCGGEPYEMVLGWILQIVTADMPLDKGDNKCLGGLSYEVNNLNNKIKGIMVYLHEPVPRHYVQLLCFMTRIQITFVHLYCAGLLGESIHYVSSRSVSVSWELMLQAYAIMSINYLVYHGMLYLSCMLSNPFGNDLVDMPIMKIWEKTCRDSYAILSSKPAFLPIAPKHEE